MSSTRNALRSARQRLNALVHPVRSRGAAWGWNQPPTVLIVGAQKCGTTSLFRYLRQHPALAPARKKEIHFFNNQRHYDLGVNWYLAHFPLKWLARGRQTFEATPLYLYSPVAARRIHQFNPSMKLLVLVRNPVDRAYSHWNMFRQLWEKDPSFRPPSAQEHNWSLLLRMQDQGVVRPFADLVHWEMSTLPRVEDEPEPSLIRRGLYADQLQRLYESFPREQVLVVPTASLKAQPAQVLAEIFAFLDVDPMIAQKVDTAPRHERTYVDRIDERLRAELSEFFRPYNQRLYEIVGKDLGW